MNFEYLTGTLFFILYRPATESCQSSVRITASTASPTTSHSSNSERRSSSATRLTSSASHRHRDRANSSAHRHSTSSLNPPRIHSAHSSVTRNNDLSYNSNSEDNTSSPSEGEFPRRRSTRRRNYLNRNQLHNAVDLPQGYGECYIPKVKVVENLSLSFFIVYFRHPKKLSPCISYTHYKHTKHCHY